MVRLKAFESNVSGAMPYVFQFHYGTIKSKNDFYTKVSRRLFQFHYDTIKSSGSFYFVYSDTEFQFHYGTIKRW